MALTGDELKPVVGLTRRQMLCQAGAFGLALTAGGLAACQAAPATAPTSGPAASQPTDLPKAAPKVLDSWIYRDGWGVPFVSSAMTLAWNKEAIPGGLKSWADLFAEGLKGE